MTRLARASAVVCLAAGFLIPAPSVFCQSSFLRGELRDVDGPFDRFTVRLTRTDHAAQATTAVVGGNGSFQFQSIPQGNYQLEVRDLHGETVKQQMVTVIGPATETYVSLASQSNKMKLLPTGAPTISLSRLKRDPSGKAEREFALGAELLNKSNLTNARKRFEKALKADPKFAEAHMELGTILFREGQFDNARAEFERAVEADPKLTMAWGNLASLLFQTKAYGDAAAAAQHGLAFAPGDPKLHFVAGASAYATGQFNTSTADHLEQAAKGFPNAHLLLAEMLLKLGQSKNVLIHLEASLVSTNAVVRARAEHLLSRLREH